MMEVVRFEPCKSKEICKKLLEGDALFQNVANLRIFISKSCWGLKSIVPSFLFLLFIAIGIPFSAYSQTGFHLFFFWDTASGVCSTVLFYSFFSDVMGIEIIKEESFLKLSTCLWQSSSCVFGRDQ